MSDRFEIAWSALEHQARLLASLSEGRADRSFLAERCVELADHLVAAVAGDPEVALRAWQSRARPSVSRETRLPEPPVRGPSPGGASREPGPGKSGQVSTGGRGEGTHTEAPEPQSARREAHHPLSPGAVPSYMSGNLPPRQAAPAGPGAAAAPGDPRTRPGENGRP